jgi:hypothetical protein
MKIFGQPDSYSDMLERIFVMSIVSGFICTVMLAQASPHVKAILDSVRTEAEIGQLKGIKALYVLVPLGIAFISRVIKLHDRVSDLLRIRQTFDTRFILHPLATGSGVTLTNALKNIIAKKRHELMYAVFYPYASFRDPQIDRQLVQTAADMWGWYWVFLESLVLFIITTIILCLIGKYDHVVLCLAVMGAELLFLLYLSVACRKHAKPQVNAILADQQRAKAISREFLRLDVQPSAAQD